jgi:hypothetical protein
MGPCEGRDDIEKISDSAASQTLPDHRKIRAAAREARLRKRVKTKK